MPMLEEDSGGLCSFISLGGREFASVAARRIGVQVAIERIAHVAGREFDDARAELKAVGVADNAVAQIAAPVAIIDAGQFTDSSEMVAALSRASGLSADNMLVAYADKTTGAERKSSDGLRNAVAIAVSKALLGAKRTDLASLGAGDAKVTVRAINAIGAIKEALMVGYAAGPVLCVSLLAGTSQLFVVSEEDIRCVGQIDTGYSSLLLAIMSELGLKFEGSAARLFFGNVYDFEEKGEIIAGELALKIRAKCETVAGTRPAHFVLSGIPPARAALLAETVFRATGIAPLRLKTIFDSVGIPQETAQVVGSPEFAHLFSSLQADKTPTAGFIDFGRIPTDVAEYWKSVNATHGGFVRIYRGTAVDESGNPVEMHHEPVAKPEPPRKIVRMYRGSPVYEDQT